MKNQLPVLVFILITFFSENDCFAQYHSFPTSNAIWEINHFNGWTGESTPFWRMMCGDTVVNDKTYGRLYEVILSNGNPSDYTAYYIGGIRDDSDQKKVWYLDTNGEEFLLYDFNVVAGDTVNTYFLTNEVVEEVDEVLTTTGWRKRVIFNYFGLPGHNWIEGVGQEGGVLYSFFTDNDFTLNCLHHNNIAIYGSSCSLTFNVDCETIVCMATGLTPNESIMMDNGSGSGSISINLSGGTPPYSYEWSNGAVTSNITGLSSGLYTVTVGDSKGCFSVFEFEVGFLSSTESLSAWSPEVLVFPNPSTSSKMKIRMKFAQSIDFQLKIYQSNGQEIYQEFFRNPSLIIEQELPSSLPAGVYYLYLTTEDQRSKVITINVNPVD